MKIKFPSIFVVYLPLFNWNQFSSSGMNHANGHTFQLCFHSEQKIQTYFVIKIQQSVWTQQYLISICPVDQCTALAGDMKRKFDYIYIHTRSVNKVMSLIQYNSVLTFKLQIEFVPFKIVPLGG